jgi:hypothetical protein
LIYYKRLQCLIFFKQICLSFVVGVLSEKLSLTDNENGHDNDDVIESLKVAQEALQNIVEHLDSNVRRLFKPSKRKEDIQIMTDEDGAIDDIDWFFNHSKCTCVCCGLELF